MKLLVSYHFPKYKPKGDVLQFLILLAALERKMANVLPQQKEHFQIDCVLPFTFQNGQDGFSFKHVRFIKSDQLPRTIAQLDMIEDYDYIFIRCRENSQDALDLLNENPQLAVKLLVLILHYHPDDPDIMKEVIRVFENCRMIFLQTRPWMERLGSSLLQHGFSRQAIDEKLKVLPQFIESYPMSAPPPLSFIPPHIALTGVLRARYGLPVAIKAVKLIRQIHPNIYLHLAYPSIAADISDQADNLIKAPEIKNHGMQSMWETKQLIMRAGIGLALIYDDTKNRNPTYSYLTRILEYASLGVPVITTKTLGNADLLGEQYSLFVQDEQDIFQCYQKLAELEFYREMSSFIRSIGQKFVSEAAIEDFWLILQNEFMKNKRERGG